MTRVIEWLGSGYEAVAQWAAWLLVAVLEAPARVYALWLTDPVALLVAVLVVLNALVCLVCIAYSVCTANSMSHTRTKLAIWLAVIFGQGTGWFFQTLAAIDYFLGKALGWPWFLLAGVLIANTGTAVLFLANRRTCCCPGCPARRTEGEVVMVKAPRGGDR